MKTKIRIRLVKAILFGLVMGFILGMLNLSMDNNSIVFIMALVIPCIIFNLKFNK